MQPTDKLLRPWTFPQAVISMRPRAFFPPTLAGKAIGLTNDEHGQFGLAPPGRFLINEFQHFT